MSKLRNTAFSFVLLLVAAVSDAGQSARPNVSPVLEIIHVSCLTANCGGSATWRAFSDGTVIFESDRLDTSDGKSPRRIETKAETKLWPDELAELLRLADSADFQGASSEYVAKRVIDGGSLVKIKYRKENVEKKVTVYNYLMANEIEKSKLPSAVVKLIELASKTP